MIWCHLISWMINLVDQFQNAFGYSVSCSCVIYIVRWKTYTPYRNISNQIPTASLRTWHRSTKFSEIPRLFWLVFLFSFLVFLLTLFRSPVFLTISSLENGRISLFYFVLMFYIVWLTSVLLWFSAEWLQASQARGNSENSDKQIYVNSSHHYVPMGLSFECWMLKDAVGTHM